MIPPNAPAASERAEELFQNKGWPADRADSMAVSAFIGNQRLVLNRVRNGEAIQLTQRNHPVAVLVPVRQYSALLAARRGEEAVRQSLLAIADVQREWTDHPSGDDESFQHFAARLQGMARTALADRLRAALAAAQEGT